MRFLIFTLVVLCTTLSACKKEEPVEPVLETPDNIAPCALTEMVYHLDSVYYGTSTVFPGAPFSVKFVDTSSGGGNYFEYIEFAFNKIPETGMYNMVPSLDSIYQIYENRVTFKAENNLDIYHSSLIEDPLIYVENNADELIISYCDIPFPYFYFSLSESCYIGNGPVSLIYRKKY